MLVLPMNSKVPQHHENASRDAYKHTAFVMTLSDFYENNSKMIKKRQVLYGFRDCILVLLRTLVFPMNSLVSNTTTMHHGLLINIMILMILGHFLRKGLQNPQQTGFIRVRDYIFAVCGNQISPRNIKVFQRHENASRDTCKRSAFQ